MKKLVSIILAAALSATALAGCGHTHVWQEATCTAPKTCTDCGETEGEALPHTWTEATCAAPKTCATCGATEGEALAHTWTEEATCAAPKTCTVCGATEGEALPHTLTEANYQSPAVCTVCGAEVGDPLPAVFEERGYKLMTAGEKYDYSIICSADHSITAKGTVHVDNYRVAASEGTHAARDGYEWRIADIHFTFNDANVQQYGALYIETTMDYYMGPDPTDPENDLTKVSYNGEEYEVVSQITTLKNEWVGTELQVVWEAAVQVPIGYDGAVLCMYNPAYSRQIRGYSMTSLDEAAPLFFRMA